MDNSFVVCCRETVCDLKRVVIRFALRQRAVIQLLPECPAFQEFRCDVRRAVVGINIRDDENVGMI
jgi:hypothetical protein